MNQNTKLTPAAKRELLAAAQNGGMTVNSLRNGPRIQLLEAGYAERIPAPMGTFCWEVRLTEAGWMAARNEAKRLDPGAMTTDFSWSANR